jgi:hypothetical protein
MNYPKFLLSNVFFLFFILNVLHSQEKNDTTQLSPQILHGVTEYPEGIYNNIEDFISKKVNSMGILERRTLWGKKITTDSLLNQIFFFKDTIGMSKLKKVFAVSYKGNLYFQQRYIVKYAKSDDSNESADNDNSFHRVISDGKYFYLEGPFANVWSKGLAGGLGGIGGAIIDASISNLKGVIFDFEKKEFDFFRNCKDFNVFLKERDSNETVDCEKYNIKVVRDVISRIIK